MKPRFGPSASETEGAFAAPGATVCGVDEAGRGPWAGPVVAAAVMSGPAALPAGVDDSKRLSAARREALFAAIRAICPVGIGIASVAEIDVLNILRANDLAMCRAVAALDPAPAGALIDGNRVPPGFPIPARAVIGGDASVPLIAAASIIAKVTRDRIMDALAAAHPGYGWETNRGYGTASHRAALERFGVTQHHRRSFRPIHNILSSKVKVTD